MNRFLHGNETKSVQTATHALTVGRFIRILNIIYIAHWSH